MRSRVTPRFPTFTEWNSGPHSHQGPSPGRLVLVKRMRSGRAADSILITSAPRQARTWLAAGPAHHAVQSRMRTPASGRSHEPEDDSERGLHWAGAGGRGSTPLMRYGTRGCRKRPDSDGPNTPRATNCSKDVTVSPLRTGPAGMRQADASSRTSADVRGTVKACTVAENSSRRLKRTLGRDRALSSSRSARPIISSSDSNCWALLVVNTTYPSDVGSMDGTSMARPVPFTGGQPMNEANTGWNVIMATAMQSNMATSTCSPTPERCADRRAA